MNQRLHRRAASRRVFLRLRQNVSSQNCAVKVKQIIHFVTITQIYSLVNVSDNKIMQFFLTYPCKQVIKQPSAPESPDTDVSSSPADGSLLSMCNCSCAGAQQFIVYRMLYSLLFLFPLLFLARFRSSSVSLPAILRTNLGIADQRIIGRSPCRL